MRNKSDINLVKEIEVNETTNEEVENKKLNKMYIFIQFRKRKKLILIIFILLIIIFHLFYHNNI